MLPRDSSIPERGAGDDLAEVRPDIPRQQFLEYVDLDVAEGGMRLVRVPVGERADDTPLEVHPREGRQHLLASVCPTSVN